MLSHYELIEEIGRGATAVVYRAWDTELRRHVVLKVLPGVLAHDPGYRHRFCREAGCARSIHNVHVVKVYAAGGDQGTLFLVMEYVRGNVLARLIPSSGLRIRKALNYALQIARAIAATHTANIIHRDLKPQNILVTPDECIKLVDFGLAKPLVVGRQRQTDLTLPGTILGTAAYMSPEQARGTRADARSDIFAYGAVFYEMLTGKRAFNGDSQVETLTAILKENPTPLPKRIPQHVATIVWRCLEKNPASRFQTMAEVIRELKNASWSTSLPKRSRSRG